jgi:chorismate mutase
MTAPQRLIELMEQRLQLADEVAKTKWNGHLPIEDRVREKAILEQLPAVSGLDPQLARDFMEAQMEASKSRQRELHQLWQTRAAPPFGDALPLQQLRPRLDRLTQPMLEALAQTRPSSLKACLQARYGEALPPLWQRATQPLLKAKEPATNRP